MPAFDEAKHGGLYTQVQDIRDKYSTHKSELEGERVEKNAEVVQLATDPHGDVGEE